MDVHLVILFNQEFLLKINVNVKMDPMKKIKPAKIVITLVSPVMGLQKISVYCAKLK